MHPSITVNNANFSVAIDKTSGNIPITILGTRLKQSEMDVHLNFTSNRVQLRHCNKIGASAFFNSTPILADHIPQSDPMFADILKYGYSAIDVDVMNKISDEFRDDRFFAMKKFLANLSRSCERILLYGASEFFYGPYETLTALEMSELEGIPYTAVDALDPDVVYVPTDDLDKIIAHTADNDVKNTPTCVCYLNHNFSRNKLSSEGDITVKVNGKYQNVKCSTQRMNKFTSAAVLTRRRPGYASLILTVLRLHDVLVKAYGAYLSQRDSTVPAVVNLSYSPQLYGYIEWSKLYPEIPVVYKGILELYAVLMRTRKLLIPLEPFMSGRYALDLAMKSVHFDLVNDVAPYTASVQCGERIVIQDSDESDTIY